MLISYVYNEKHSPIACVVAVKDEKHGFKIGVSKCRVGDRFKKTTARNIAFGRATSSQDYCSPRLSTTLPYYNEICFATTLMAKRAMKYFRIEDRTFLNDATRLAEIGNNSPLTQNEKNVLMPNTLLGSKIV